MTARAQERLLRLDLGRLLRPSLSEENVPLNLGVDEDEVSPVDEPRQGGGRRGWMFELEGEGEEDGETVDGTDTTEGDGDFDCHICLRTATNPCVTRCGHLFCRRDLEHWIILHPRCPVCNTSITAEDDVVTIFGRGRDRSHTRRPSSESTKTATPPSVPASLPSPPATPSPVTFPAPLPSVDLAATAAGPPRAAAEEDKDRPPAPQPLHPLLIEQFLRHQFARILSLIALVFFLFLLGLQRS